MSIASNNRRMLSHFEIEQPNNYFNLLFFPTWNMAFLGVLAP